jgi:hypothetical protein
MGLLTYQLTLVVERYPSGVPTWFADGLADYARSVYGPADDNDWSLPDGVQPQDSYTHTQGSGVAARFLLWLEQHTRLDIVDQLNHALKHTIYVYINGDFIAQMDDWNSSYGTVGMMAVDFGNPTDVRYENVQVF